MDFTNYFIKEVPSFPKLPSHIHDTINFDLSSYSKKSNEGTNKNYIWSDDNNKIINQWCQDNVIPYIYYAFQIATENMPIHKDKNSTVKLIYVLDAGGENVLTSFFNDDKKLLHTMEVKPHSWYMLKTDVYHAVEGISRPRFSICATVFRILDLVQPVEFFK